jgi:hypothetical protein
MEALRIILVFAIGKGLGRGHGERIAGMDPHGINVLDGTDDDHVIVAVTHHLQLEFLPTQQGTFRA